MTPSTSGEHLSSKKKPRLEGKGGPIKNLIKFWGGKKESQKYEVGKSRQDSNFKAGNRTANQSNCKEATSMTSSCDENWPISDWLGGTVAKISSK